MENIEGVLPSAQGAGVLTIGRCQLWDLGVITVSGDDLSVLSRRLDCSVANMSDGCTGLFIARRAAGAWDSATAAVEAVRAALAPDQLAAVLASGCCASMASANFWAFILTMWSGASMQHKKGSLNH